MRVIVFLPIVVMVFAIAMRIQIVVLKIVLLKIVALMKLRIAMVIVLHPIG